MNKIASQNKELVLALIKADMRNMKLIMGLERTGFSVEYFPTDLSQEILRLVGFEDSERNDDLSNFYIRSLEQALEVTLDEFRFRIHTLALDFYNLLLNEKISRGGSKLGK